jgi:four helix bundle protein
MNPGVRDLKVWQESVALGAELVRAIRRHGRRETKAFTDPLLASAGSVALLIAEGYGGKGAGAQRECYQRAKNALIDLETRLAIARNADLIPAAASAQISSRAQVVGRLLVGYLSYLDRQVEAEVSLSRPSDALGRPASPPALHKTLDEVHGAQGRQ